MKRIFVPVAVLMLAMCSESAAHRLDEYLQATRVSLAHQRITLEVDLTPGVRIASAVVAFLDRDGDHTISPIEAGTYGQAALADMVLELDGHSVAMTLTHVEVPPMDDIRDGIGTIQLRAVGKIDAVAAGRRVLHFRNNHQPLASVYLVNALIPEDRDIDVVTQTRDPRQRSLQVEYSVGPRWPGQLLWLGFGLAMLLTMIVVRKPRTARMLMSHKSAP